MQSVGQFPTTDQFIQYLNTRMIEKAAVFAPPSLVGSAPSSAPHYLPPILPPPPASVLLGSAPPLELDPLELDGGKKTRRKATNKKRKPSKKSRHNRRR